MPGIFDNNNLIDIIRNVAISSSNDEVLYGQTQISTSGYKTTSNNLFIDMTKTDIIPAYDYNPDSDTYGKLYIMCGFPITTNIVFSGDRPDDIMPTIPIEEPLVSVEI